MEQKILGELFGVTIHSPIIRSEVRGVLKKQLEFKALLQSDLDLTEDQAFLEVADIFESFFNGIAEEDKDIFEKIHAEEVGVAPQEWFLGPTMTNDELAKPLIDNGLLGSIYHVDVTHPFTRKNIREVVDGEKALINNLMRSGLTKQQAELDAGDLLVDFYVRIGSKMSQEFSDLLTQEKIADIGHQSELDIKEINLQTERQIQAVNNYAVIYGVIGIALVLFIFFALVSR